MRAIALRPEHFDPLGDFGWLDGGCRIYAAAACAYLGPSAAIAYVVAEGEGFGPLVDHAVAVCDDHVFDGDGAAPLDGYLERYARLEGRSGDVLELLAAEDLAGDRRLARGARELPENAALSRALAAAWRRELGPARA